MEITITHNINVNAPALIDFFREIVAVQTKGQSILRTPEEVTAVRAAAAKETGQANITAANSIIDTNEAPRPPIAQRGPRSKKEAAPAAVAPASPAPVEADGDEFVNPESWTEDDKEKHKITMRKRLSDLSADKRYGIDAVFAILKRYGIERIGALPPERYAEFKKELDDLLAKPA